MEQERKRAEAVGYPDPININYNVNRFYGFETLIFCF